MGSRAIRCAALFVLVAGLAACRSAHRGSNQIGQASIQPGRTTKTEVLQTLGSPAAVLNRGDDKILKFNRIQGDGRGAALGVVLLSVGVSHMNLNMDTVDIRIGSDQVVKDVRIVRLSPGVDPRLWPFYEYGGE